MKKSESEGIRVAGIEYHTVPKDMVEEALILSDMYDLDELMALDLLTTGKLKSYRDRNCNYLDYMIVF